jgi:hypothetical protein
MHEYSFAKERSIEADMFAFCSFNTHSRFQLQERPERAAEFGNTNT